MFVNGSNLNPSVSSPAITCCHVFVTVEAGGDVADDGIEGAFRVAGRLRVFHAAAQFLLNTIGTVKVLVFTFPVAVALMTKL